MRLISLLIFGVLATSCELVPEKTIELQSPNPAPTVTTVVIEKVIPDVPQTKPVFHETIDTVTSNAGMKRLRDSPLADDDIEVRIWGGFGLTRLQGFILLRKGSSWGAYKMGYEENRTMRPLLVAVSEPDSGWQSAWESMLRHQLLTLPSARSIKCEANFFDGYSYVVELKKGANYRTYMYDNPDEEFKNRCSEADEILAIAKIVRDQYHGF